MDTSGPLNPVFSAEVDMYLWERVPKEECEAYWKMMLIMIPRKSRLSQATVH